MRYPKPQFDKRLARFRDPIHRQDVQVAQHVWAIFLVVPQKSKMNILRWQYSLGNLKFKLRFQRMESEHFKTIAILIGTDWQHFLGHLNSRLALLAILMSNRCMKENTGEGRPDKQCWTEKDKVLWRNGMSQLQVDLVNVSAPSTRHGKGSGWTAARNLLRGSGSRSCTSERRA